MFIFLGWRRELMLCGEWHPPCAVCNSVQFHMVYHVPRSLSLFFIPLVSPWGRP